MDNISIFLPPFSPDYSGFCSALFALDGVLVIHDAGGCTGNFTAYDEPRWFGSSSHVFSSGLREIDAVIGDDGFFIEKINKIVKKSDNRFVALIGSPVPMVIGTDFNALAHIIRNSTQVPVITFDANGIDYYDVGASAAFLAIAKNFILEHGEKIKNSVNIIGAIPLDLGNDDPESGLCSFINNAGYTVISSWGGNSKIDAIMQSGKAELNLVVSRSGLAAARYMEEKFRIPYVTGLPIGESAAKKFSVTIAECIQDSKSQILLNYSDLNKSRNNGTACIVAEQVMGNSLRECLISDFGFSDVIVCSFFEMDLAISNPGDIHLNSENDLVNIISSGSFDVVIGDPLIQPLISDIKLIPFPHIAISSRIFWNDPFHYIGIEGFQYLKKFLNPYSVT